MLATVAAAVITTGHIGATGSTAPGEAELESLYAGAQECSNSDVVVYGPGANNWTLLVEAFSEQYPGVAVELVHLVGPEHVTRMEAEFTSGNVVVDVAFGTQLTTAMHPRYADWYEVWVPASAAELEENLVGPEDGPYWFAPYGGVFGWAYNTNLIGGDEPPSWEHVVQEEYRSRVGLTDPASPNGTSATFWLGIDVDLVDEAWMDALAANDPFVVGDSARLGQALVTGEVAAAALPLSNTARLMRDGAPVGFNPTGSVAMATTAAVVKESQCTPAAKLFAAFMLTDAGQAALAGQEQVPLMPGAPLPDALGGQRPILYTVTDPDAYDALQASVLARGAELFGDG